MADVDTQGQVGLTAPEGQAAADTQVGQVEEPFFKYEDQTFKTQDDLSKYIREGTLRQSDYTKKTQSHADAVRKFENDRAQHLRERTEWEKKNDKYMQFDSMLRSNPAALRLMDVILRQSPSGEDAQDMMKKYVDETYGPKFEELEKAEKLRRANEERDQHFAELQKEFPDLNREQIQKDFDELMQGSMRDMMRVLHFAGKGRSLKPEEIKAAVVEDLAAKKNAKIPSSKGAAPPAGGEGAKSFKALANKLKEKAGGS